MQDTPDDDLALLLGGDTSDVNSTNSQIAAGIRVASNPNLVVDTVKVVLEMVDELENAKHIQQRFSVISE